MSSRTVSSLNVTNGDAVLYLFKKAGILGTHLPWRDMLHEGPVPAGVALETLSHIRAEYLVSRGFGKPIKIFHDFESRDATLARAGEFEEVVLWFEHDLFDQLQVLQVLVLLDEMHLEPGRVSIIQSDSYLGSMTVDEISALHPKRRSVTRGTYTAAKQCWDAFTSSDPLALFERTRAESSGLPFMRAGLLRLCEEYPGTTDGLSRSQRHALQAVAQGPAKTEELFRRAQAREDAPFLGDLAFAAILDDLARDPAPLAEMEDGYLVPTALGRRVLAGDADWLDTSPTGRWIGGVQVEGPDAPRWDEDARAFRIAGKAVDS